MTTLAPLRDKLRLTSSDSALLFQTVMEAACLVADADDELDRDERATLRRVIIVLSGDRLAAEDVDSLIDDFRALRAAETGRQRCRVVGRAVAKADVALDVVSLMAIIGLISRGLDRREKKVIADVGAAAGLTADQIDAALAEVSARLAAPRS